MDRRAFLAGMAGVAVLPALPLKPKPRPRPAPPPSRGRLGTTASRPGHIILGAAA